MTKDEALKLALEAIEGVLDDSPKVLEASITGGLYEVVQCRDAITAIKEALAQSEQDGKCKYCTDGCPACDASKLPEQEPVACKECHLKDTVYDLLGDLKAANLKLSVRAKRTWVGLTDEDLDYLCHLAYTGDEEFALAVQAKLKEKNT